MMQHIASIGRRLWVLLAVSAGLGTAVHANDDAGWTPIQVAPDAVTIYVDAQGDDAHDGRSPAAAVRSLDRGMSLLRSGKGDVLLLQAGDVWRDQRLWVDKSDIWISSYGDGGRPLITTGMQTAVESAKSTRVQRDVRIIGIAVRCYLRDPTDPQFNPNAGLNYGLRWHRPFDGLLIEDCYVEGYAQSYVFMGLGPEQRGRNLVLRRSLAVDSWDRGMTKQPDGSYAFTRQRKGQNVYLEWVQSPRIEENIFDHGGLHPDHCAGTMHGHGIYIQAKDPSNTAVIRGNIIARAASDAIQCRESGQITGNLILDCPIVGFIAGDGGAFAGNLVLGSGVVGDAFGWGFSLMGTSGSITDNTFAHKPPGAGATAAFKLEKANKTAVAITGNSLHDWAGDPVLRAVEVEHLTEAANSWQGAPVRHPRKLDVAAFMTEARKQRKGHWRREYTAQGMIEELNP